MQSILPSQLLTIICTTSVYTDGLTEDQAYRLCYDTWHRTGYFKPLFHYSESHPDKDNPRSHADMPSELPKDGGYSFPVDYDVELKAKDDAIHALEIAK